MPDRNRFIGSDTMAPIEALYATELHELVHWSGGATRLNRVFGKRFGDQSYAAEELVAELGAAFLYAELQITQDIRADHAQYLHHWLKLLKGDNRAIFTAASTASAAVRFLKSGGSTSMPPAGSPIDPVNASVDWRLVDRRGLDGGRSSNIVACERPVGN